uniref:Reverse transcriptase domain-containing protein n=1 Tax=Tanacetum cinerariifolium TaxID=118510 RepID=A0A6L2M8H6_TANCI|nr:hypothetical protein [Tanacetum cinerariifolium]
MESTNFLQSLRFDLSNWSFFLKTVALEKSTHEPEEDQELQRMDSIFIEHPSVIKLKGYWTIIKNGILEENWRVLFGLKGEDEIDEQELILDIEKLIQPSMIFHVWTIVVNRSVPMVSLLLLLFRDEDRGFVKCVKELGGGGGIVCMFMETWSRTDLTLLKNSEMAAERNGDLPVPDLRTMEELCQPSLNCRGGPIAPIAIQETNFGLKNDMIQQVQNSCQFHAAGGAFMKRRPEECYDLIENMTAHHNDWDTLSQRKINNHLLRVLHVNQQVKTVIPNCETCGGPYSFFDCPATVGNTQNVYAAGAYQGIKEIIILRGLTREETNSCRELTKAYDAILKKMQTNMTSMTNSNLELKNMFGQFMKMNTASSLGSGTLLVKRKNEVTKDTVHPVNNESTKDVQLSVVLTESPILTSEPVNSPIIEPVASPVSASRPNQRPSIPYPSRLQDQKLRDKANDQREKFFQIFKDLNFNISFADALILMPKFSPLDDSSVGHHPGGRHVYIRERCNQFRCDAILEGDC